MIARWLLAVALATGNVLPTAVIAQDVTPDGASLTANSNGVYTADFWVMNWLPFAQTVSLACGGSDAVTSCNVQQYMTYENMHQAMGGTLAHEIRHRRDPSTMTKHSFGKGDTAHDKVYQFGFACAGFSYIG